MMIEFGADGTAASGYLAARAGAGGPEAPGIIVLHAWWGLTEPFREVCDRLAEAGFIALAPDLYRGKTTALVEEAETLARALDRDSERVRGDLRGAVDFLRQPGAPNSAEGRRTLGVVGFSLGGAYALDLSVDLADAIAAVVTFYASYPGLDYRRAKAAYLCHFAEDDPFEPAESVATLERELHVAGRESTFYTYPGTSHWFFEANRPAAFNAAAAASAWGRTLAFLNRRLRPS
jgi:carboxymethylenebutenolidase